MPAAECLELIGKVRDPRQRELAAKALLRELASGAELASGDQERLESLYREETDIATCTLLQRALTRLRTRALFDRDPSIRFDPVLSAAERDTLASLAARLRLVVDEAKGAGGFDRRYTILRLLADGGMGQVFLARRKADGANAVIKLLHEEHERTESFRARFRREAAILERLAHPQIVRLYEWGEIGSRMYLVMEYLPGGDVGERLGRGPLPIPEAAAILVQTLDGLAACHAAGIIHRDVKPGNLFLAGQGSPPVVKLGDFGLARDTKNPDSLTHQYTLMGSEPYMAREQREDPRSVGPATDLYSFGVTVYEIHTGGDLPIGDYPPASKVNPTLPVAMDAVIQRCLALRPADRWQSARELRMMIEKILV